MIDKVLNVLRSDLDAALNPADINPAYMVDVIVDNIAREDNDATAISNKVVITLLSVEEEATLKNSPRYVRKEPKEPKEYIKNSPAAYLNLFIMIAANRDNYENSLINISKVIETIQTQKILVNEEDGFKCKAQMHPLPFDQLSYVWGLLGGKVIPSAFYKISIVKIHKNEVSDFEKITEIDIKQIMDES